METGDLHSAVAVSEAAARLQLGGIWTDVERTNAFQPCNRGLPAIFHETQAAEEAAFRAMEKVNPMGKGRFPTPEALAEFTAAQEKHRKCKARREELMSLTIATDK